MLYSLVCLLEPGLCEDGRGGLGNFRLLGQHLNHDGRPRLLTVLGYSRSDVFAIVLIGRAVGVVDRWRMGQGENRPRRVATPLPWSTLSRSRDPIKLALTGTPTLIP